MAERRALISVSNKSGVVEFAKGLHEAGFEILSTGGTARVLGEAGVTVTPVDEVTGFPEMLDGRLKTLHPMVHGGILGRRDLVSHRDAMREAGIKPIDVVCVNLYPFEQTVDRDGVTRADAVEQIDIGGPAMVRSAAKNHDSVVVVTDPAQYDTVLSAIREGEVPETLRRSLARAAYARTAAYDAAIASWLETQDGSETLPSVLLSRTEKVLDLRYGENPHQCAAFYADPRFSGEACVARADRDTDKKALSYNNLMDLDASLELVKEFDDPAAAVIKHTNPCGVAVGGTLKEAYEKAHDCDPVSAFGCILAVNRVVDLATAESISSPGKFVEAIVAPGFDSAAAEMLRNGQKWGKSLRMLSVGEFGAKKAGLVVRQILGGLLVQERDLTVLDPEMPDGWKVVTERAPTAEESANLRFGFAVVKHVKSNAIVLARDLTAVGVGAGQMSRVESAELAVKRAADRAKGAVCASDAFFPFPDAIHVPAAAGVTAFVQPGGSIRDKKVIAEADRLGVAMVMTGMRHFRH